MSTAIQEQEWQTFSPLPLHPAIQHRIWQQWQQGRLPHAFLFYGPAGVGKEALALEVARLLNCESDTPGICNQCPACVKIAHLEHPDVHLIFPTPAESNVKPEEIQQALQAKAENPFQDVSFGTKNTFIGIDTIRDLKRESGYKRFEGKYKVYIFTQAEKMRPEAANALLKLLEEPPEGLVLILITESIHKILPTIKSRCQLVRFPYLPEATLLELARQYLPDVPEADLPVLARLSGNNLKRMMALAAEDVRAMRDEMVELLRRIVRISRGQDLLKILEPMAQKKDRERIFLMLWLMLLWFQDVLYLRSGHVERIHNRDAQDTLEKFNAFLPHTDIPAAVFAIEQAIQELQDLRNLNPLLILVNLAIKLHSVLKS